MFIIIIIHLATAPQLALPQDPPPDGGDMYTRKADGNYVSL